MPQDFEPNGNRVAGDEAEKGATAFMELVAEERLKIAKARFAGQDPSVTGPRGAQAVWTVARVLAADREGAMVQLGERTVNPSEDRAEEALQRAIRALSTWDFDAVRRELGDAAAGARVPSRQQRIGAIRALSGLVRALVLTLPGDRLRGEETSTRGLLARLDALPELEVDHYRSELERLLGAWREAATSDDAWCAWALLRARLAVRDYAEEAALAWTLRAWDRSGESPTDTDPALVDLLGAVRKMFRDLAASPAAEPDLDDRGKPIEPPRALDVLAAVATALAARAGGAEPLASTTRFAFVPYHAEDVDETAGEGEM